MIIQRSLQEQQLEKKNKKIMIIIIKKKYIDRSSIWESKLISFPFTTHLLLLFSNVSSSFLFLMSGYTRGRDKVL